MVMAPSPCMTQQCSLASMAAWVSSTGVSHHDLLPHKPSVHLSTVNSSPRPGIAPQSLNSSSQLLPLPGDQHSCPGYVWLSNDCPILTPFRLPQISCFTLSLKCSSCDSDNSLTWGSDPWFSPPPAEGRSSPTNTPVFALVPSFCRVLHGSMYSFPLVRCSCLLPAGVPHARLYLKESS